MQSQYLEDILTGSKSVSLGSFPRREHWPFGREANRLGAASFGDLEMDEWLANLLHIPKKLQVKYTMALSDRCGIHGLEQLIRGPRWGLPEIARGVEQGAASSTIPTRSHRVVPNPMQDTWAIPRSYLCKYLGNLCSAHAVQQLFCMP